MKKKLNSLLFFCTVLILAACKKEPGLGGNSTIYGKLNLKHYNHDFSIYKSEEPAIDQYVYIVFKNGSGYGDRVKTAYDGSFEFSNLRKGNYTIYAYSMDTSITSGNNEVAVVKDVSISKNRTSVDAGTIEVADNKPPGHSKVNGKVYQIDTGNNNQYYLGDARVYIIYDNDVNYTSSIKTNFNGEYVFDNLPFGHYTVYTYSKDVNNIYPNPNYPVSIEFDILDYNQKLVLPDLIIYK